MRRTCQLRFLVFYSAPSYAASQELTCLAISDVQNSCSAEAQKPKRHSIQVLPEISERSFRAHIDAFEPLATAPKVA